MAELPKIDSEGLRMAKKEGSARVSSVVSVTRDEKKPERCTCTRDWGVPENTCSDYENCTQFKDLKSENEKLRFENASLRQQLSAAIDEISYSDLRASGGLADAP